ncbi:MAG: hypothetical protein ACREVO_10285 [Steroidobacteraceae bacterium]
MAPSTASHDRTTKLRAYERAGVPAVLELEGRSAIAAVPGVSIDWDRVLACLTALRA